MAALGHQQRRRSVVLGEVGDGGVTQLVEGPAAGVADEQLLGAAVGEPRAAADGADVGQRRGAAWAWSQAGEEHRSARPAGEQPRQQPGGAGLKVQPLAVATLGGCGRPPVRDVEILDVERQDLARARGRLIQQAPQCLLAQRYVAARPEPLERYERQRAGLVEVLAAALEPRLDGLV